jgi:hypothetical protein
MSKGLLRLAHYKSRKRNESQDDTEAIWGEESDVPSIGRSWTSRQQLGGAGG